ncbi:MAG TPA: secretin N-terminal domain-containing protein [Thermoanaerobaculia bacterium]|nr:secretin N-terminal domain-containing protein [Thermoanaerobaculia bacterium]
MTVHRPRPPRSFLLAAALALAVGASGCASERAFREAQNYEQLNHWDMAVMAYQKAASLEPANKKYEASLFRARLQAAHTHLGRGRLHRSAGQLDLAQVELEQSVALDPTNDVAVQELRRVVEDIETRRLETTGGSPTEKAKARAKGRRATPPMLNPASDKPIDVTFPPDTPIKKIYQALSTAAGINVIFDPQLKDDKFTIDLRNLSFQKALETTMRQAGHFYKVIDEKTILVAQDTQQNRKEYEDQVVRTFFLSNGDVKDVSAMVRGLLDLRRMATVTQLNAIVIRDTADKVAVAERLIEVNDKAKAEVVLDVELLQLSTKKLIDLGAALSSYAPITAGTATASDGTAIKSLPWNELLKLSLSDFNFTIPSIAINFLKSNTDAEILARPQLRIAEGEKAQLVIGDRVPIPVTTINTQQAVGQVGVVPVTSFQYQDIGIKLDIETRVHHNKEVSLKLTVEVSNLNGYVDGQNGQKQPIIATRTITSNIRLKDGETSFLAGLIQTTKIKTKVGMPFLADLPLVGPLFGQTNVQNDRNDIFLTLTPHITRAPQIDEEDLIPVWVGTENNVSFSGLNVRLESPQAPVTPFDPPSEPAGSRPVAPTNAVPSTVPGPGGLSFQGSGPNDPFRPSSAVAPSPAPAPPPQKTPLSSGNAAPASSSFVETAAPQSLALGLEIESAELSAGETTTMTLSGPAELTDAGALEVTLEWDPAVAEIVTISPGPWRTGAAALNTRLDADRGSGRVRIGLGSPTGVVGLPSGALARFTVRALAPGKTLFRMSAGAGYGKTGALRPEADAVALSVAP